jgi:hypothetical protein
MILVKMITSIITSKKIFVQVKIQIILSVWSGYEGNKYLMKQMNPKMSPNVKQ